MTIAEYDERWSNIMEAFASGKLNGSEASAAVTELLNIWAQKRRA